MANALYDSFKESLISGEINLVTDNIVAYAVDTDDYTFSAAHELLSDLTVASRVAVTPNLSGKTVTNGAFDSADPVLPSVSGDQFEAVVLYDSTSDNLIAYFDGLLQTPTGNNITINVNASGWFTI